MKERLKSAVVWIAVIAQVCMIIAMYNSAIADNVKIISTAVVEVLTLFGILNNPTDRSSF